MQEEMSKNALPGDQERYSVYVDAKVVICFEVCKWWGIFFRVLRICVFGNLENTHSHCVLTSSNPQATCKQVNLQNQYTLWMCIWNGKLENAENANVQRGLFSCILLFLN